MTIQAYLVGGSVRDRLLGIEPKDLDYAVEAPSFEAMVAWIAERGKIFLTSPQFLTVRAKLHDGDAADYVLCRKESNYTDGRRPDTVEPGTLYDDLRRRDFTVNAMAEDADGNLIDPHNGLEDVRMLTLRAVGSAYDRLNEDALRVLRAIRFAITKDFQMDKELKDAINNMHIVRKLEESVSVERKREELKRCFAHSTITTLRYLAMFPAVSDALFYGNKLWLMPTTQA